MPISCKKEGDPRWPLRALAKHAARAAGKARYFDGKPCPKGHVSERFTAGGTCIICAKERVLKFHRRHYIPTRPMPEKCEICDGPPNGQVFKPTGKNMLCLDHCHLTGTFRGWLCHTCNSGIGLLKDDPRILRKAAQYLENAYV